MSTTSLGQSEHTRVPYLIISPEGTNITLHTSHQEELAGAEAGAGEGIIIKTGHHFLATALCYERVFRGRLSSSAAPSDSSYQ